MTERLIIKFLNRWKCKECDYVCKDGEYLVKPNPFDIEDEVVGCPNCKAVNSLVSACYVDGCKREASNGAIREDGIYKWACYEHGKKEFSK